MLSIKNLQASVEDKQILKGLNLEVKAGEVHAIMGPNGAGKSTLGTVLAGRDSYEVTGGEVTMNGGSKKMVQHHFNMEVKWDGGRDDVGSIEATVSITYEVGDVLEIDLKKYGEQFDVVFMEGGILHYFHDIDEFMKIMNKLLKANGKIICSDFHPFTKISDTLNLQQPTMSYFSKDVFEGEMAHVRFYDDEIRTKIPKCSYRKYTISEIINSLINAGFILKKFDEHPAWENEMLPGEFTAIAIKE